MNGSLDSKYELMLSQTGGGEAARLVMSLLSTAQAIDAATVELLARYDLSEGRLTALLAIGAEPDITPARLADRVAVTRATITGLVDGLQHLGLIKRAGDRKDRRSVVLRITRTGEARLREVVPLYAALLNRIAAVIGADEREIALGAMAALRSEAAQPQSGSP